MKKPSLCVVFIAKNEEFHIGDAIDNVKDWAEAIFVVDSGSTDATVQIAKDKGAEVLYHPFKNFGDQWNWALDNCPIKSNWTMKMDPDERLSESLKQNISELCAEKNDIAGMEFDRVLWFMGKRIPSWRDRVLRVWRTGSCRFTDVAVNEYPIVDGRVCFIQGLMEHLDSRDLHQWVEKQNKYTTAEALRRLRGDPMAVSPKLFGSRLERRMWIKKLFFRLPFRYGMMFCHLYFGKRLFLLGRTGFECALLRMWSRRLIEQKMLEAQTTGRMPKSL